MKPLLVLLMLFFLSSYRIHKGSRFKSWSKDFKNGFHLGMFFASMYAIVELVLLWIAPF